jgi:glutathione reductase (NADPH)
MSDLEGHEHCISSNEAFHLEQLPESILIAGGGYIAVEFANIFHGLGVKTTLIYRGNEILSRFDKDLRSNLQEAMITKGIDIQFSDTISKVEKNADGKLSVTTKAGNNAEYSQVMLALGRIANTDGLGLEKAGVEVSSRGAIVIDEYSKTNIDNIYALGDVTDKVQLTPVAIHEAMCFLETVYKDNPISPDHELIPTAVFSQPEIGTVGMSEEEAAKAFSEIEVYKAQFRPMRHTLTERQDKMMVKLVVNSADRKVLGAHILGPDAGELVQVLGITLKAGCTKDDFDRTMAVHPSASEELVTMYSPSYRIKNGERV